MYSFRREIYLAEIFIPLNSRDIQSIPEIIWGIFRVQVVASYLGLATEVVLEPTPLMIVSLDRWNIGCPHL